MSKIDDHVVHTALLEAQFVVMVVDSTVAMGLANQEGVLTLRISHSSNGRLHDGLSTKNGTPATNQGTLS